MLPAPPPPPPPPGSKGLFRGLLIGLAISLALFIVLSTVGGVVAYSAVKKKESDVRKGWNLVPVVVAAVDVSENSVVTFDMISQRSVPEQFVTSSVVKPDSASYIVNQKVLVPVQAGDMLLWSQFETTKAAQSLSGLIGEDGRIVSIKVSPEASVGGWVRPKDLVDVIAVFVSPETKELTAATVMQGVEVVATGKITATTNVNLIQVAERDYSEVSLLVRPEEAERLALMAGLGTLTLSLRRPDNTSARAKTVPLTVKAALSR